MKKPLLYLTLFSIAMAFLESAVVVYLRIIYYPEGFDFPLAPIDASVAVTEILRELATMIMLLTVSIISGKNFRQRFAYFIFCFGVWDIFYYVFLYLLLGWPESLFTWDILFLIPVTWTGPVIAPVIVSFTMIGIALSVLIFDEKNKNSRISRNVWAYWIAGAFLVFLSFIYDYSVFVLEQNSLREIWNISGENLFEISQDYIPESFNWLLFWAGEVMFITGMIFIIRQKPG
ncbi:MAG: hypothetical protein K0B37_15065 [Bacteroidales bacterium]|nr:hypothetical protein [Bacteroidales bacterium]